MKAGAVNSKVDAVYVLSVRSFADRIAHVQRQMATHGIAFEFIFDHDADALTPELIARTFGASDMRRTHQSLVLKHMAVWQRMVEKNHTRALVFEDDVLLDTQFNAAFVRALDEADALAPGWSLYLGRGDNHHVGQTRASTALIAGGPLPAADALVCDLQAAQRRLAYLETHPITRPADWLIRETDAAVGIAQWWLARPIVEQGSMNGLFASALDDKRQQRGRLYAWLRYRWDKFWRQWRYAKDGRHAAAQLPHRPHPPKGKSPK